MALVKNKELDNGIVANYIVAEPHSDAQNKTTNVLVLFYLNKEAREAGKRFLHRENVGVMDSYLPTGADIYTFVKQSKPSVSVDEEGIETTTELNWFFDAVDDI